MTRLVLCIMIQTPGVAAAGVVPIIPRFPTTIFEPKKQPAAPKSEVEQIVERIAESSNKSSGLLAQKDAGAETQRTQESILRDIDQLLNTPPPPPQSSSSSSSSPPPPESGESQTPPPEGGSSDDSMKPESPQDQGQPGQQKLQGEPQQRPGEGEPMPSGEGQNTKAQPKNADAKPGTPTQPGQTGERSAQPLMLAPPEESVTKAVWGHLPETLRQQMDQFYREEFMPEYSTLLQQYYAELAQQKEPRR